MTVIRAVKQARLLREHMERYVEAVETMSRHSARTLDRGRSRCDDSDDGLEL